MRTRYRDIPASPARDGSLILPGGETLLHRHRVTEEIYPVTAAGGCMTLGAESFEVGPGKTVCIPPGMPHRGVITGAEPLRILCCPSPAAHGDTEFPEA
jgi:mannose-6-phosphate isomerase-like protein (cupin superfamily)